MENLVHEHGALWEASCFVVGLFLAALGLRRRCAEDDRLRVPIFKDMLKKNPQ